jgi:hypothetical protein
MYRQLFTIYWFVATREAGLFMLNGNMFVEGSGSEALMNKKVVSLLPYGKNKLLIVTAFDAVFLYDGVSVQRYNTGIESFLMANQVFVLPQTEKKLFTEQFSAVLPYRI